jgi:hypothetical protein
MYIYWMVYPSRMRSVRNLALIAIFVSTIIATNYGLAPFANVKLEDVLVFVSAYLLGLRVGITVAVLAETIWGIASPYGFGGPIIPFLVAGELLYAVVGSISSQIVRTEGRPISSQNVLLGGILAACALGFDIETNAATAFIVSGVRTTFNEVLDYEFVGIPFMIAHELSDFILGTLIAPPVIIYARKLLKIHDNRSRTFLTEGLGVTS